MTKKSSGNGKPDTITIDGKEYAGVVMRNEDAGDHVISVSGGEYHPETVWEVDHSKSPMAHFFRAVETGKVKTLNGYGKEVEANFKGIKIHGFDHQTGTKFRESLNPEQSKAVFLEGKDAEIISPKMKEAIWESYRDEVKYKKWLEAGHQGKITIPMELMREDVASSMTMYPSVGSMGDRPPYNDPNLVPSILDNEFLPYGNGPFNQQLYLADQWDMQAKAFESYHHNPYAKRAIEILVDFVLGRGFSIVFNDDDLHNQWIANTKKLKFLQRAQQWLSDLERSGELFLHIITNPITGDIDEILSLEASTIWEVITDPENINDKRGYWQQYQTAYQVYTVEGVPDIEYIMRMWKPEEIIHIKVNASGAEKRGRSSLFTAFEHLKMARDYLAAGTNKALTASCLVFDWTIKGGPADVQNFASSVPPVDFRRPVQSVYHTAAVEIKAMAVPAQTGGTKDLTFDAIIGAIAVATGISKDYLGTSGSSNRSSSLTQTEPSTKHFERRQTILTDLYTQIAEVFIEAKIMAGVVPAVRMAAPKELINQAISAVRAKKFRKAMGHISSLVTGVVQEIPLDRGVRVKFPAIVKGDISQVLKNVGQMQAMGHWSPRRAAIMATHEWPEVDDYDYDEEQKEIEGIGLKPIAQSNAQVMMVDMANPVPAAAQSPGMAPAPYGGGPNGASKKNGGDEGAMAHIDQHPASATGAAHLRHELTRPLRASRGERQYIEVEI